MSSDVRKILCFVVALSTLVIGFSGCQSRKEQRLASYKALCESRGHKIILLNIGIVLILRSSKERLALAFMVL